MFDKEFNSIDDTVDVFEKKLESTTVDLDQERQALHDRLAALSKQGYLNLKKNLVIEAKDIFNEIREIDEFNNYALVGLGDCERKLGNYAVAIKYYRLCLQTHDENSFALFGVADCYKALGMFPEAIKYWELYLAHDERNITVLTRVADLYRKTRNYQRSNVLYQKVLALDSVNAYALIGLGHLHYDFKDYESALSYWMQMLAVDENGADIRVLTSIGNCHRKLRTYEKGIRFFERSLALEPNNFYSLFGLADCYRGLGQQEKSIVYWDKILAQDPRNRVILTRMGDALRSIGQYEKSAKYYTAALDIDFDVFALLGLAEICKAKGQYQDAIDSLTRLIQNEPNNYRLYIELADCYLHINRRQDALNTLRQFQALGIRNQQVNDMVADLNG
jgi:tetratricopeptide (TPR) repeat protein